MPEIQYLLTYLVKVTIKINIEGNIFPVLKNKNLVSVRSNWLY